MSSSNPEGAVMRVLVIGAGVVGTVYGAHLGAAGHDVTVLAHGTRTAEVAAAGLIARDVIDNVTVSSPVRVIADLEDQRFDLVLVAVQRDQLPTTGADLATLAGAPTVLFFGNNPAGSSGLPSGVPAPMCLGFPGIGGVLNRTVADYVRIPQQPTALPVGIRPALDEFATTLRGRGFAVQRVADMDGWLVYHAAFVACVAAALTRCDTDPVRLAGDRPTLTLMCHAITEAFTGLRRLRINGLPRNLAFLHNRLLIPVAVRYWARTMRSPMGELAFAAHTRHAAAEMRGLADDLVDRLPDLAAVPRLLRVVDGQDDSRSSRSS
jgi:2-dehydropantoate 2-reductase